MVAATENLARADVGPPWINAGVSEIVVIPEPAHYAVYAYLGASLPIATGWHEVYVIPGLIVEIAPEVSRGGVVASVTFERSVSPSVAADLILSLAQDQQDLDVEGSIFSLGVGLGLSFTVGDFVLSPSCYLYRVVDTPAWSLAPTLNLSHSL